MFVYYSGIYIFIVILSKFVYLLFTLFKAVKSLILSIFSSSESESVQTISSSTCSNKSSALFSGNSSISSFSTGNIGLKFKVAIQIVFIFKYYFILFVGEIIFF